MTEQYLVSFDTDRIKDYVFATDRLREIRGASYLLTELNESLTEIEIRKISPNYRRVFFAGGSAAVLVPSEDEAKQVVRAIEDLYWRKTYTGSITGTYIPLAPATDTSGFGKRIEMAALKLRQAKDEKARRTLMAIEPYTQPCAACERFPAVRVSPVDQQPICESCHAKREAFNEYRQKDDPSAPEDLNALGEVARPLGYVGFIYADGNRMGQWLNNMQSVEAYKAFATGVDGLISEAVNNAFDQHSHRNNVAPYERLLVGGDDLMLVTAGDIALSVALDIAEKFERGSPTVLKSAELRDTKPLTLGVGVVLAHASFPIAAFQRLAAQLMKKAKQRCTEVTYQESAIDFMVVTAAGSSDLSVLREEVLTEQAFVFPHGDRRVRLTQRPYTVPKARQLLEMIQRFRHENFPRSQLQFLYEGLFHSQVEAVYRWGKVAGRARPEHRQLMEDFNKEFGDGASGLPPWRRDNNPPGIDHTTALGDLIEIYQFVAA